MFTSVKNLTAYIDKNISYVLDAKNHHDCSEAEYEDYLKSMEYLLDKQLVKLDAISSNKQLVEKYKKLVRGLF